MTITHPNVNTHMRISLFRSYVETVGLDMGALARYKTQATEATTFGLRSTSHNCTLPTLYDQTTIQLFYAMSLILARSSTSDPVAFETDRKQETIVPVTMRARGGDPRSWGSKPMLYSRTFCYNKSEPLSYMIILLLRSLRSGIVEPVERGLKRPLITFKETLRRGSWHDGKPGESEALAERTRGVGRLSYKRVRVRERGK